MDWFDGRGLGRDRLGDADGNFGAGEVPAAGVIALSEAGFGGDLIMASNLVPCTVSLIIFCGLGPSLLVELEDLSGALGRLSDFVGGPIDVVVLEVGRNIRSG